MAANIAAISYIGRRLDGPRRVLLAGLLYALGRAAAYVALALLITGGVLSNWRVAALLQASMPVILGPVLVLVAMVFLDLVGFTMPGAGLGAKMQSRIDAWGLWGALPLGIVLALWFCPVSAACFFISLLTMAAAHEGRVVLPAVYGLGTAVPVIFMAAVLAGGAGAAVRTFDRLRRLEHGLRRLAALVLLAVGIHLSLKYNLQVAPPWDPWLESLYSGWTALVRLCGGH
jgi:cytochrome c biogenesis protein CcdA